MISYFPTPCLSNLSLSPQNLSSTALRPSTLYLALPISGAHKDDVFWEGCIRHQDLIQLVIYHLSWNLQGQKRLLGSPQGA